MKILLDNKLTYIIDKFDEKSGKITLKGTEKTCVNSEILEFFILDGEEELMEQIKKWKKSLKKKVKKED